MRIALLAFLAPTMLAAQTLVSTSPENRTGILEEFTAINCPICPQGHVIAANLLAANLGDFIVVGVHGGALSVPSGDQPDFRTTWGNSLWSHFGVNAQPLGLMNRTPYNGQLLLTRSVWANALSATLATPSPVNIGAATQFDQGTRDLTVNVEVYYTAAGSGANDHLCVLLIENDILGYQATGGANYAHQHVLRSFLSPLWGDEMLNNAPGTLEQRTYTFNVSQGWDIDNCHVVAFVGEFQSEVHNAVEVGANNFSTGVRDERVAVKPLLYPQPASDVLYVALDASAALGRVEVRDLSGRSVARITNAMNGTVAIDVSGLAAGTYILSTAVRAQRFVVAH
jgi:hypothetical protein